MKLQRLILFTIFGLSLYGCASENTDTCVEDKKNGGWQAIVDSSRCSAEQKGEAYLALGGFDYFDFITKSKTPFATILELTPSSWESKHSYFDSAANTVRYSYASGSDRAKNVFLLGSFAAFFTYTSGKLDNGEGDNTAFDGKVDPEELNSFLDADRQVNTDDDGTTLVPTTDYQIVHEGTYYIVDASKKDSPVVYRDVSADGMRDATADNTKAIIGKIANWTAVNQVVQVDQLTDPLANVGKDSVGTVTTFAERLLGYTSDVDKGIKSLITDGSEDDLTEEIVKFREMVDNGGKCSRLDNDPNLKLVSLFLSKASKEVQSNYANYNIFTMADLEEFKENTKFAALPDVSVEVGVRMIYKKAPGVYVPNWGESTSDVKDAMERISKYGTGDVKADDNIVTLAEIVCAADLFKEYRK